jgi:hypothetical protein
MNYEQEFGPSATFAFYVTLVALTIPVMVYEAARWVYRMVRGEEMK